MNYFIKENDNVGIVERIFLKIKKEDEKLELPINVEKLYTENKCNKISNLYIKMLIKKIIKIINNNPVILSKSIKSNKEFTKELEKSCISIYDGKWLYRYILEEILEYILNNVNEKKENIELSFLVNYVDDTVVENIKIFAKEYKRINIITNHIEKFQRIEEELYDENGIILTISNNKRKSLYKSKILINMDFPNELINKYNIYEHAIIINLEDRIRINKKRFNGLVINDYSIKTNDVSPSEEYDEKEVIESMICRKDNFYNIRRDIEQRGLYINGVFGNNGEISLSQNRIQFS